MAQYTLTNKDIIKGSKLMVFIETSSNVYEPIAFATSHSLSITMNTTEISTKDHGDFPAVLGQNFSWEVTTENLYSDNGKTALINAMKTMQPVKIEFAEAQNYNNDSAQGSIVGYQSTPSSAPTFGDNWTPDSTKVVASGQALVTSLQVNAASGDRATMSATFKGVGELDQLTVTQAQSNG